MLLSSAHLSSQYFSLFPFLSLFIYFDYFIKSKFVFYLSIVAAKDDIETQQNGLVVLVWFASTYKISYKIPLRRRLHGTNRNMDGAYGSWGCVRVAAIHVCTPDTPAYRFRRSIMAMRTDQYRSRLKLHVGKFSYYSMYCINWIESNRIESN